VLDAAVGIGGYGAAWIAAPGAAKLAGRLAPSASISAIEALQEALLRDPGSPLREWLDEAPPPLRVHSRRISPNPGVGWIDAACEAGLHGLSLVCLGERAGERRVLV